MSLNYVHICFSFDRDKEAIKLENLSLEAVKVIQWNRDVFFRVFYLCKSVTSLIFRHISLCDILLERWEQCSEKLVMFPEKPSLCYTSRVQRRECDACLIMESSVHFSHCKHVANLHGFRCKFKKPTRVNCGMKVRKFSKPLKFELSVSGARKHGRKERIFGSIWWQACLVNVKLSRFLVKKIYQSIKLPINPKWTISPAVPGSWKH